MYQLQSSAHQLLVQAQDIVKPEPGKINTHRSLKQANSASMDVETEDNLECYIKGYVQEVARWMQLKGAGYGKNLEK